jgi:hypothetical protein
MANIALTTAAKVEVVGIPERQLTVPAAEAIVAGAPIRLDANGKWVNGNATTATEAAIVAIAADNAAAGVALTGVQKGRMDGFVFAGAYGSAVYVSDTDARLADAPGTQNVQIGRVVPKTGTTLGTAYDKILEVDIPANSAALTTAGNATKIITSELLAASVDKYIYVADGAYQVTLVEEIHSVVGGASAAVRPRKILAANTSAPGAAVAAGITEISASIDCTAAINVTQTPALVAVAADLLLADGDKIALDFSGTLTGLVGVLVLHLKPV